MQKTFNVCSRCGKERIVLKTSKEMFWSNEITVIEKVCPDIDCQKIVDKEIRKQKNKKDKMERLKEDRILAKKAEKDAQKLFKQS